MADYDASVRVNTKVDNGDLVKLQKDFDKLQNKLDTLYKRGEKLEALGVDKQSKQWKNLTYEVAQAEGDLYEVEERIKEINQLNTNQAVGKFAKLKDGCKRFFDSMNKSIPKSNKLLTTMLSRLQGIALSLLIFNWITKGFNAMVSAMQAGFQNLAHYSEEYNQVMSDMKSESATLKNSLAAAFEPIVTTIVPYITTLISWLNTAMDYLAQFWAVLSGKSTYTKAKKQVVDYAKSLKDASGSAKGALAAFDEINVLDKDNGSTSAGGEVAGADAFEEVAVDQSKFKWVDWLRDNLDIILGVVELIGLGLLGWKLESAIFSNLDKLTAILDHLNLVVGIAMAAVGAFVMLNATVDAWQNGIDWENLSGMLIGATLLVAGLGLAFGGVGTAVGALIAGIVLLVVGFKDAMNNGLNLKNTLAIIAGTFLIVFASINSVIGAVIALIAGIVLLVIGFKDVMSNGLNLENTLVILAGTFLVVFASVNSVFGAIVTLMAGIVLLIVSFKDIMESGVNLQNSLMAIAGTFLVVSSIAGAAVGAIAALVAGLVLAIIADWNNFKQMVVVPLQAWLEALLANAGETLEGIKGILRGIIQFVKGVFTADWRLAWTGIKNIFTGIWKAISGTVKLVVNTIIGIINTMINGLAGAINAVINAVNSISFTVPDWVPFFGGNSYQGFNIPTLPSPANIPYLEYGGTVTQETYAKISEGNRKEVVLPLEQHTEWADLLADKIGTRGTTVIRFEGSLAELGRVLKPVIDTENSRVGVSLAQN